jgi:hypothetical protein
VLDVELLVVHRDDEGNGWTGPHLEARIIVAAVKSRPLLIALAAQVIVLFCAMPASPWEFDEILFYQGLHHYDPLAHHPPPPGYPLFIHVGQLVRLVTPSDLAALVSLSFVASLLGFALLALAFGKLTGDKAAGLAGAMFFYWSPAMLINSTLPMSDAGALGLLAASLYFASVSRPALFALFAALAIGWRPQCAIFVVPFFLCSVSIHNDAFFTKASVGRKSTGHLWKSGASTKPMSPMSW